MRRVVQRALRSRGAAVSLAIALLAVCALGAPSPLGAAVASAGGAAEPLPPAISLGPPPVPCFGFGESLQNICPGGGTENPDPPDYLAASQYGTLEIQKHIVHVGQDVTMLAHEEPGGEPTWAEGGPIISGCTDASESGGETTPAATSCTWEAVSPSPYPPSEESSGWSGGWQVLEIGFCEEHTCAPSGDYYYAIGAGGAISGYVLNGDGKPAQGAQVAIQGAGGGVAATVNPETGFYNALVPNGHYDVSVEREGAEGYIIGAGKVTACLEPINGSRCDVEVEDDTAEASFHVSPASISGTVTGPNGSPLAGAVVEVTGTNDETMQPVSESTSSNQEGEYGFSLEEGEYTVTAVQPASRAEGRFISSDCSGVLAADTCQIVLGEGQEGVADFRRDPLVVNSTLVGVDEGLAREGVCDVTPAGRAQTCTLPQAILVADAVGGARIEFDVLGGGVPRVVDPGGLPEVSAPSTIDGSSEPGGEVEVSGQATGSVTRGLVIGAGGAGSTVRGMVINGYSDELVLAGGDDTIRGDFLGSDPSGVVEEADPLAVSSALGQQSHIGVRLESSGSRIGGGEAGQGNVIATGWTLNPGAVGAIDDVGGGDLANVIQGNWIGVGRESTLPLLGPAIEGLAGKPVQEAALLLAGSETVGGSAPGEGNVIAPAGLIVGSSLLAGNTIIGSLRVAGKATIGGASASAGAGAGNDFLDPHPAPPWEYLLSIDASEASPTSVQGPVGATTAFSSPGGAGTLVQGNHLHEDPYGAILVLAPHVTIGGQAADLGNLIEDAATQIGALASRSQCRDNARHARTSSAMRSSSTT